MENCTCKVLATLTHAEHSIFLFMLLVGVCVTSSILFLFAVLVILAVGEQNPELVNGVRVIRMSQFLF